MMRTRAVHLPLQLVSQAASASAQQEQHRCLVMLQSYSEHGTGDVLGNAVLTGGVSSFVLSVTSNSSSSHAATRWVTALLLPIIQKLYPEPATLVSFQSSLVCVGRFQEYVPLRKRREMDDRAHLSRSHPVSPAISSAQCSVPLCECVDAFAI